jgi:hypothetical protein
MAVVEPPLITDVTSAHHLGPELSGAVDVLATIALLYLLFHASLRLVANLRLGLAANRSFDPRAAIRPGRTVVSGGVELLPSEERAVRVEIDQRGAESRGRGGATYSWTEETRRVYASPFLLRVSPEQTIRVEPDREVQLVDKLDQTIRHNYTQRTLVGELTPGEKVYAVGQLVEGAPLTDAKERGYREAPPRELVLRAPPGGRLLLAAERLGSRYYARARFHLRFLLLGLGALALLQLLFLPYHLRWLRGRRVVAEVTRRHSYVTGSGKSRTHHHHLYLRRLDLGPVRSSFYLDAAGRSFDRVAVGDRVALLEATLLRRLDLSLGARPTVQSFAGLLGLGLGLGLAIGFVVRRRSSRPWYDQDRYTVSGKGTLWPGEISV